MKRMADLAGRELRWVKSDGYELRDGDTVAATLRFRSMWGSLATAESADGCWTFKRVGSTESGEPLVRFTKIGGLLKLSSTVEILPASASAATAAT